MKIWVTGGAGFIGSNIIKSLNNKGYEDIVVIDDLTNGKKIFNLNKLKIFDYVDRRDIEKYMDQEPIPEMIYHQGACSNTNEWDGRYIFERNYDFSKTILNYALIKNTKLTYASSASVYGTGRWFEEDSNVELPINAYAYSKHLFDEYVRKIIGKYSNQIIGLRYFNVYGPGEGHKGKMASVMYHMNNAINRGAPISLFKGNDGYADGGQMRDFVYIDDIVAVNLWTMTNNMASGIYNCGSGRARSFNDVANAVIKVKGAGEIQYIEFPDHLVGSYQSFTKADLTKLRAAGYTNEFCCVEEGIAKYFDEQ